VPLREKPVSFGSGPSCGAGRTRPRWAISSALGRWAARSEPEMAAAGAALPSVAKALVAEEIDPRTVAEIVSEELRAMTERAAVLAEEEMRAAGLGGPPVPYAVLVLGSAGRGESLLAADQDNAIVFEKGEPGGAEDRWFAAFGTRIAAKLDRAGIARCQGGVMAENAEWRGSLALWRDRIGQWVRRSRAQDLLNVDIFFDLAPVHGEKVLGETLFQEAYAQGRAEAAFPLVLGERLAGLPTPFTILGNLRTKEGRIDLKRYALFPLVSAARVLSIRHGIGARSTRARLEGLIAREIGSEAAIRRMLEAHKLVLSIMLAQQGSDLHLGIPVSNSVEVSVLSREQRTALKGALRDLEIIPEFVHDLM
jgi:CBS domain-containing protein